VLYEGKMTVFIPFIQLEEHRDLDHAWCAMGKHDFKVVFEFDEEEDAGGYYEYRGPVTQHLVGSVSFSNLLERLHWYDL